MTVKIDKAGRIVVPKSLRDRLRLHPGAELEVEESEGGSLLLRPAGGSPALVEKDGLWIHTGKAPSGIDWDALMTDDRELRIRELAGR